MLQDSEVPPRAVCPRQRAPGIRGRQGRQKQPLRQRHQLRYARARRAQRARGAADGPGHPQQPARGDGLQATAVYSDGSASRRHVRRVWKLAVPG